jgi:hypothetical protein
VTQTSTGGSCLGCAFARDRHLLKVGSRWRPLDGITEPIDGREHTPRYLALRAAYKKHLEGRKPVFALRSALDFLNREVAARGIKVYDPSE